MTPSSCVSWSRCASSPTRPSIARMCSASAAFSSSDSRTLSLSLLTSFSTMALCFRALLLASCAAVTPPSRSAIFVFHVEISFSTSTFSLATATISCSISAILACISWTFLCMAAFSSSASTTRVVSLATSPWMSARCRTSVALSESPSLMRLLSRFLSSTIFAMRASSSPCSDSTAATRCMNSSAVCAMASSWFAMSAFSCVAEITLSVRLLTSFWISGRCARSLSFSASAFWILVLSSSLTSKAAPGD
mmetsp:Transcript_99428/g.264280  ORF Transcript_99428/g.264280 Transcript_99428/m.264280 type:complete len:250 (-) Transcript_99428:294-1043(-)